MPLRVGSHPKRTGGRNRIKGPATTPPIDRIPCSPAAHGEPQKYTFFCTGSKGGMGRGWLTFLARNWLSARRDPKFRAFQSVQGSMAIIVQNVTPSCLFFPFGGAARRSSPNNWDARTPICGCFGAKPAGTTPATPCATLVWPLAWGGKM